ncbi:MAG: cyclase family protein [Hydrogenophaga sp.]|uniref:cyclase family protein n=1 Tax=Hydrogenophaga sp. TaxID=1904254 RepID=UPI0025C6E9BD|nr:cyclase family protein [Hydrogenophaga sp.]MBT9553557.1 cyclase family protein [Hydrogenophaga sp.]
MKKLWDISPPVHAGAPVFPGDTAYSQQWVASIGPGCPVNVSAITLSPHVGAHADAPLHYDPEGAAIGAVDLQAFIGPCRVIHAIGCGPLVRPEHIAHALGDSPLGRSQGESAPSGGSDPRSGGAWGLPPRVLVRVYERMPQNHFDSALPAFAPETVALLADRGVLLIGIDSASIDPADSKLLTSHQTIRQRGLRVLENLLLDDVPEGDYELIALPLKLTTADASPVRAVLRSLE